MRTDMVWCCQGAGSRSGRIESKGRSSGKRKAEEWEDRDQEGVEREED